MNFATLKGLTIPEGVVTQIADASGRVLWSAVKPVCTVTITDTGSEYAHVTIDGVKYTTPATLEVPVGTTISCFVGDSNETKARAYVEVNGTQVVKGVAEDYDYTVAEDTIIDLGLAYSSDGPYGKIEIFEADKACTLTLGNLDETDYFATEVIYIDKNSTFGGGRSYTLLSGVSMKLSLSAFESGATVSVFLNGQLVFVTTKTNSYEDYYFTLNHDTTIERVENSSTSCYVYITET